MIRLKPSEFFELAGIQAGTFKSSVHRGEAALAFGTDRELAGGTFLDLDVVAWLLVEELSTSYSRKFAAEGIVRRFSDQWMGAVEAADRRGDPVFLIVIEVGEKIATGRLRSHREGLNVGWGPLTELAGFDSATARTIPDRITLINVTSMLRRLRNSARRIGLDFSAPFLPEAKDPEFERAMRETRAAREKLVARVPR